jgi:hypothetical protein
MTMPTETPNKPPSNAPANPPDKPNQFRAEMPQIPGVNTVRPGASNGPNATRLVQIGGLAAAALLIAVGILWWVKSASHQRPESASPESAALESSVPPPAEAAVTAPVAEGPTTAATTEELAQPWSAKKFIFVKPLTHENLHAMVIRLPNGGLWAFALQEPYGRCELEFVTDLSLLTKQYGYRATHPMVVNPCNSTIYDPLKVGPLGSSTWVRGEIVQGAGLRPPISIDVQVNGQSILADRIE